MHKYPYNVRVATTEYNPFDGVTDGDYDRDHPAFRESLDDSPAESLDEVATLLGSAGANVFRGENYGEYRGDPDTCVLDWAQGIHADVHAWVTDHYGNPITPTEAAILDGKLGVVA